MSKDIQAYKYARNIFEKLDELIINTKYTDEIESLSMNIKSKPFKDEDDLLPLCYRCSHHNSLMNPKGNQCTNCGQPYVFSFATFMCLPLVEFILPDDITDEEAMSLIDYVPNSQFDKDAEIRHREAIVAGMASSRNAASLNRLVIGDEPSGGGGGNNNKPGKDPFVSLMNKYSTNSNEYKPVIVNREVLKAIDPTHVFICKWPSPLRWKFYKIILTNEPIVKCNYCNRVWFISYSYL
jgi:intraflagellar transport protein 122